MADKSLIQTLTTVVEVIWFIIEYMLMQTGLHELRRLLSPIVQSASQSGVLQDLVIGCARELFCIFAVISYFSARYKHLTSKHGRSGLGTWNFTFSGFLMGMIIFHVLDLLLMIGMQLYLKRWIFSLENFYSSASNPTISYSRVATLLLFTPIQEEFIFRGYLFFLLLNRLSDTRKSVIWSNIVFGIFHIVNAFGGSHSGLYVALQILLAVMIGTVFGLRFAVTNSIWECVLLHMLNNVFSSFLSSNTNIQLQDPIFLIPIVQTIAVYSYILYISYSALGSLEKQKQT
mmetsp:Transcript_7660/g.10576  ORF Transcript_7660/g.10576 Transcript_7660/m.10576 type:complete len:288 (-) Transcript_7660:2-865(-)